MSVIAYYEPRRLKEKDFLASFIAREELLDFLLNQLRQCADGDARHRLILGQRGMGKTSLLRRLQIGIRDHPELTGKLLPLTFREEQYNVRSLDRFWRNCGEALAEWLETSGDQTAADQLDKDLQDPIWNKPDSAAEAFASRVSATGRRPVLLVDNLDLILNALPDQQRWQLRRILQAPGGPIMYGAATQPPQQLGDPNAAFYDFFRWDFLEALTEAEMMTCIRRLAAANPATSASVVAVLEHTPERLRVLHTLTGGNPRILALLYGLLERADSDSVHTDLEGLLDQVTPLYKARVEDLRSDLQRAVFDAIALHWDPITTHDLSLATGVEVTSLSPQIARLRDFGLIEEVPTSGARAGYQLGERFFNVWYLMRHGTRRTRQRMRWLTGFLETFYSGDELLRLRERYSARIHGSEWASLVTAALDAAIERVGGRFGDRVALDATDVRVKGGEMSEPTREWRGPVVAQAFDAAWEDMGARRYEEAKAGFRQAIQIDAANTGAWIGLGIVLMLTDGKVAEAEKAFRTAIGLEQTDKWPWICLGRLLMDHLGRYTEAEEAFRTAIRLDPNEYIPWADLGCLLTNHLGRYAEAEQAYRTAIGLDPAAAWPWDLLGDLLTRHLDRHAEAEENYRTALRLDPGNSLAWSHLGIVLMDRLGRDSEAEEAFRRSISLDPTDNPWLRLRLTNLYATAGRLDEALQAREDISELDAVSTALLDATIAVAQDNFGQATKLLAQPLKGDLGAPNEPYFETLYRLLRLFQRRGYGERLIQWFVESGHADSHAPIHRAFVALVRGPNTLLDVNPEVRAPAERIFARLAGPQPTAEPKEPPRSRRGRPRRRIA
jgi:Flp pilus assembly protein TadD